MGTRNLNAADGHTIRTGSTVNSLTSRRDNLKLAGQATGRWNQMSGITLLPAIVYLNSVNLKGQGNIDDVAEV